MPMPKQPVYQYKTNIQSKSSVKSHKSTHSLGKSSKSKSRRSAKSRKSGVSNASLKSASRLSNQNLKPERKPGTSQRTKNHTATNMQVLFKDASKSSVPISQSFFDNLVSPSSNYVNNLKATGSQNPHNREGTQNFSSNNPMSITQNDSILKHEENDTH